MRFDKFDNLDAVDWLKLAGYGLAFASWFLAATGYKRDAAGLAKLGHAFAFSAGVLDLLEAPKHCGQRAVYRSELACHACPACGAAVAFQPRLGFSA